MLDNLPFFADLLSYWPQIVRGLRDTILLSVTVTATGLLGGIGVFALTLSSKPVVRYLTQSYISLFIGSPLIVTRVEDALIMELGRRPAYEVAQEVLHALPESDRALLRNGVFMGVVINEYRDTFNRGDFLVRGVMGGNPDTGALAVGDMVRAGQTVQFHVRDSATAHEDLEQLLLPQGERGGAAGALLISCNGRGTRMFAQPHHDLTTTRMILPGLPVGGFFAMGEFGPVGGKSFIHGHTASLAVFRPE